jgi:hypothetical protein
MSLHLATMACGSSLAASNGWELRKPIISEEV